MLLTQKPFAEDLGSSLDVISAPIRRIDAKANGSTLTHAPQEVCVRDLDASLIQ